MIPTLICWTPPKIYPNIYPKTYSKSYCSGVGSGQQRGMSGVGAEQSVVIGIGASPIMSSCVILTLQQK